MGDPRRQHKRYTTPRHPWQKDRIDAENKLTRQYGLRGKRELWKAETVLRNFRRQARRMLSASGDQAVKETQQMLARLQRLGLIKSEGTLDDVLGLGLENVLDRRLQTVVFKKGLAHTPLQARQLISHGHVDVEGRRVTVPSYLVSVEEEGGISHKPGSSFAGRVKPGKEGEESEPAEPTEPIEPAEPTELIEPAEPAEEVPKEEPEEVAAPAEGETPAVEEPKKEQTTEASDEDKGPEKKPAEEETKKE